MSPPPPASSLTALQRSEVVIDTYKKRPRVLLIERHDRLRATLADALNSDPRIGEVATYNATLASLTRYLAETHDVPHVMLSSVPVHGGTVFDVALTIWLPYPHIRIVGYTATTDDLTPRVLDRAEECGVTMVALADTDAADVGTAIRAAFIASEASALGLQRRPLFHADYLQLLKERRGTLRRRAADAGGTSSTAGQGRPGVAS